MDAINTVTGIFNELLMNLFSILPDSPILTIYEFDLSYDVLGTLNFIIPFDIAEKILILWSEALFAYYGYCYVQGTLSTKSTLFEKIFKFLF